MKQLEKFIGSASKIVGAGRLTYYLWFDSSGEAFVQISNNELTGTHSSLLYRVSEYADQALSSSAIQNLKGYDPNTSEIVSASDNNDSAFLKAIIRNLIVSE